MTSICIQTKFLTKRVSCMKLLNLILILVWRFSKASLGNRISFAFITILVFTMSEEYLAGVCCSCPEWSHPISFYWIAATEASRQKIICHLPVYHFTLSSSFNPDQLLVHPLVLQFPKLPFQQKVFNKKFFWRLSWRRTFSHTHTNKQNE